MNRVDTLREQAAILRKLAESFDDATMRADLLGLAERCEQLAQVAATKLTEQATKSSPSA